MTQPLRILHVEDEPQDVELVQRVLEKGLARPVSVAVATSRDAFLARLSCSHEPVPYSLCSCGPDDEERLPFDVVLADFSLPGFDGLSALRLVRQGCAHLPFLFVTGTLGEERAVEALRAGATDIVLKDRLDQLPGKVERAVREHADLRTRLAAERALSERNAQLQSITAALSLVLEREAWGEAAAVLARHALATTGSRVALVAAYHGEQMLHCLYCTETGPCSDLPLDDGPIGHIVRTARPLRLDETDSLRPIRGLPASWPPVGTLLGIPLLKGEEAVGLLLVAGSTTAYSKRDQLALQVLAGPGAILAHTQRRAQKQEELTSQFLQAQKLEAVGRLAGGVAHDFNNLLSVINGYAELTLEELPEGHPIRGNLELIHRSGGRAAALTRQLLLFSRKSVTHLVPTRLDEMLRNLLKMLQRLVGEDIRLELSAAERLPAVVADVGQLEQAITNLVVNARDAMQDGGTIGISLTVQELDEAFAQRRVDVVPGRYVCLAVKDQGCGIDESTRARIFEPFFTTKEPGKGTGLGLSTVYSILKSHSGFVDVASTPGSGSTFRLYVPASDAQAFATEEARVPAAGGSERLLVVEDDDDLRDMVARILTGAGYAVKTAPSGDRALELLANDAPMDLMLTDVVMPGMRGPDLAQRAHATRPEMRVAYMSGYADTTMVPAWQLALLDPLISKPFSPSSLLRRMREILDREVTA